MSISTWLQTGRVGDDTIMEDIESTLHQLGESGLRLIDERPRVGIRGSRVAFVHPASTGGVLTEIVQPTAEGH